MANDPSQAVRRAGRRRDPEARRRILDATLELVREVGYSGLVIEQVAARAGVGRPTIYRWWPTRAELAHEAIFENVPEVPDVDTGRLSSDLVVLVRYLTEILSRPEVVSYFRAAVAEIGPDDPLAHLASERTRVAREHYAKVFDRAAARGEVRSDVDVDAIFFAVYGGIQTWIILGPPVSQREMEERFVRLITRVVGSPTD
jgi:AcrR family transcriptional regulator